MSNNATVLVSVPGTDRLVRRYRVIGTNILVYASWEPMSDHSTQSTLGGGVGSQNYGRVGTRRLPTELESLPPMIAERAERVNRFHMEQFKLAYDDITTVFPHLKNPAVWGAQYSGIIDEYLSE